VNVAEIPQISPFSMGLQILPSSHLLLAGLAVALMAGQLDSQFDPQY
jgi:hypothetical protein